MSGGTGDKLFVFFCASGQTQIWSSGVLYQELLASKLHILYNFLYR
jgi:hypothetical protein